MTLENSAQRCHRHHFDTTLSMCTWTDVIPMNHLFHILLSHCERVDHIVRHSPTLHSRRCVVHGQRRGSLVSKRCYPLDWNDPLFEISPGGGYWVRTFTDALIQVSGPPLQISSFSLPIFNACDGSHWTPSLHILPGVGYFSVL